MASNMALSPSELHLREFMNFIHRFQTLQVQYDSSDELIRDLILYSKDVHGGLTTENARLRKELEDAQLDLVDATKARMELEQKVNVANVIVGQSSADVEAMKNRNPYIIVLIDGDGLLFTENLISQGVEGGKEAANILKDNVLRNCSGLVDEIEVIAKVCANVGGLAQAMRRDGTLSDPDDLRQFALGFTQGKASFDFIDVGHGKERAISKIKECMRWHLRNFNCKHILLGVSHNAGYAPFIEDVVAAEDRGRITMIEGPPTVRELKATGLQTINFNNIFRSEKLISRPAAPASSTSWAGVAVAPPPPSVSPVNISIKSGSVPPATTKKTDPKPKWSPGPRGLDSPIPVNAAVLEKVKRRTQNNKLCNNHYLRGPCFKDDCTFEHDYKPSDEEINTVAYLSRLNPCVKGQDCENEKCIYGHHCPSVVMVKDQGPVCQAFVCKFTKEDHPPNTFVKNPRKERWDEDYERC